MQKCGPCANARCRPALETEDVEPVRVAEHRRVPVGGGQGDAHPVPGPDHGAADRGVPGRVPVEQGGGRFQPQRLLDRGRDQARVDPDQFELHRVAEQCRTALAIIPSVVSIPPNKAAAASEMTSGVVRSPRRAASASALWRSPMAVRRSLASSANAAAASGSGGPERAASWSPDSPVTPRAIRA